MIRDNDYEFITSTIHASIDAFPALEQAPGTQLNQRYAETIQRVMGSIAIEFPEFVGFTVFGSLSRDEAVVKADGTKSDIDGIIIIDADKTDYPLLSESGVCEAQDEYPALTVTALGSDIRWKIFQDFERVSGVGVKSDRDLLVVSHELLVSRPDEILRNVTEPDAVVEDWGQVDENVRRTLAYFIGRNKTSGLFFPERYGDLDEYRNNALLPLVEYRQDKPQITSRIWELMRMYTSLFQKRKEAVEHSNHLPTTLDEAIEQYVGS